MLDQYAMRRRPQHDIVHQVQPMRSSVLQVPIIPGKSKGGLKVIQKVNVGVKETKAKKKRTSKVRTRRKEYNKLKKVILAEMRKAKSTQYKKDSLQIKTLPAKDRKAARTKLKRLLADKFNRLKKEMPSGVKLKIKDIDKLILSAKNIKW